MANTASDTRALLSLLGRSLTLGTNPASPAYVGHDFLLRLTHHVSRSWDWTMYASDL